MKLERNPPQANLFQNMNIKQLFTCNIFG
jgi:hypothetical protein